MSSSLKEVDRSIKAGEWDLALQTLESLKADQSQTEVYTRLAHVQAVRGRYQSVIGTFLELVGLLLENGSLEQAERFLQQALTLHPESSEARERSIELERKRGNLEKAIELSRELARLCIEQGDGERSIRLLRAILAEQPDNLDVALELAEMFVAHGHITDGAAAFRRVAASFETAGRPGRAVEAYRRLKVVQSDDCEVMLTLGRLHIRLGQYEEAERELRAVLRHDLEHEQALLQLGWVCQLTGRVRSGILAFSKVLQTRPHHPVANRKLAELHFSQGMMNEAVDGFVAAATGYLGEEALEEAIVCYRHVLAVEPGNGVAQQALARLESSCEPLEIALPGLVIVPVALEEHEAPPIVERADVATSESMSPVVTETEPPEPRPELLCENAGEPPSRPRLVRRGLLKAEFGEKLARPEKKVPGPVRHGLVGKPMGPSPVSDKPLLPSPKLRPYGPASPRPEPVSALPDPQAGTDDWQGLRDEDFADDLAEDFGQHLFEPEPVSVWQPESLELEGQEWIEATEDAGQQLFDPEPSPAATDTAQPEADALASNAQLPVLFDGDSLFEDVGKDDWGSLFDDWEPEPAEALAPVFVEASSRSDEPLFPDEPVDEDVLNLFPIEICEAEEVSEDELFEEASLVNEDKPHATHEGAHLVDDEQPVEEVEEEVPLAVEDAMTATEAFDVGAEDVAQVSEDVAALCGDVPRISEEEPAEQRLSELQEDAPLRERFREAAFELPVEDELFELPVDDELFELPVDDELFETPLTAAQDEPAPVDLLSAQQRAEVSQARAVENLEAGLTGGDAASLMAAYRLALGQTPDNIVLRTRLADLYLKYGLLEDAILHYREVLNRQPDAAYALRRIVQAELWSEQYREVTESLLTMAELSLTSGRSGEAVEALQDVLALDPEHCPALERLAGVFLSLAQDSLACHHLRHLAETALGQGDLSAAMVAFGRLVDVADSLPSPIPSDPGLAASRYINLLLRRGQVLEAGRTLQRLERSGAEGARMCSLVIQAAKSELGTAGLETQFQYGELCYRAGHLDRAIEAFQQTRRHPDYERASTAKLGQCFAAKGGAMMAALAVKQFQKALALPGLTASEEADLRASLDLVRKELEGR